MPYKPSHSTSSSHSHSFSPRTHGFRSTTIPAVINNNNRHVSVPPRGILLRIEEQSRPHRRESGRPPRQHEHGRLPACLTCRIPFPPHLARSFPPHLIPLPPCTPTLHVLVRGVDTIPYKPWHSTSSSHSHSFSPAHTASALPPFQL